MVAKEAKGLLLVQVYAWFGVTHKRHSNYLVFINMARSYLDLPPREIIQELDRLREYGMVDIINVDRNYSGRPSWITVRVRIDLGYGTISLLINDTREDFLALKFGKHIGYEEGSDDTLYFAKDGTCRVVIADGRDIATLRPPVTGVLVEKLRALAK